MKRTLPIGQKQTWLVFLLVLFAGCGTPQQSSESRKKDGSGRAFQRGEAKYNQATYTQWSETDYQLSQQLTQRHENPDEVMALLNLTPGMVVSDIGCGVGFYTFRFAQAVGSEGTVYAIDIVQKAVDVVQSRAKDETLNPHQNVVAKISETDHTHLESDSLDLGFYSHMGWYMAPRLLPENVLMLLDTHRVIRPGGLLVVLQYARKEIDPSHIKRNIESAGFELEKTVALTEGNSVLYFFRKPEQKN